MQTPPPQGFSQYPRPQGTPSGVRPLPPGAHLEAINEAWALVRAQLATWMLATLVFLIIYMVVYIPAAIIGNILQYGGMTPQPGQLPNFGGIAVAWLIDLIPGLLITGLAGGLFKMALKQIRGEPIGVGDLFSALGKTPQLAISYLVVTIAYIIGLVLCIIPGLWVIGSFSMTPFFILDQDQGPFEALSSSYNTTGSFSTGISMFGVLFVLGLVGGLGIFACCVGYLATMPIYIIGWTLHYYYYFPERFGAPQAPSAPVPQG